MSQPDSQALMSALMSAPERLQAVEPTCAYVETIGPWGPLSGTAYRLSGRFAATSERLVHGLSTGDTVELRFPSGVQKATLVKSDAEADCALLELTEAPPGSLALPLSSGVKPGAVWEAYGYPGSGSLDMLSEGVLLDSEGEDPQRGPAIILRSTDAGSWRNAAGIAGSPVLVDGQIIGHLKSRFGTDTTIGQLYACPIRHVEALLPVEAKKFQPQPPQAAYDSLWYVRRDEEEQNALSYLNFPGQPVVLFAPELFGKTWLMRYLAQKVQKDDPNTQVVSINLDLFDQSSWQQPQGLDTFLRELALHIALSLGDSADNVHREWNTPSSTANLDRVMRRRILPLIAKNQGRLLLAIDRADAVLGSPFQNTFFGILRGWAESEVPWSCLRLILSISTTPALLVSTQHQSPFNLTDAVELKDLRDEQILRLCRHYQLQAGPADLQALKHWVGGHPYLVRLAMYTAVRQGVSLAQLFDTERPAAQVFDGFLSRVGSRLRGHPERFEALQRVLTDPTADIGDAELPLLRAGILVRGSKGEFLPRYELYRRLGSKTSSGGRLSKKPTGTEGDPRALRDTLQQSDKDIPKSELRIEIGKRLGPYEVIRELGRGGMGVVYEVMHEQLKRRAALKVLHPQYSRDPEIAKRFLTEARAANVVHHPSIINVYEIGQLAGGETYFVMEFLEGESLGDRLQRSGKLPLDSALRLTQQIAAALSAAHLAGVIHRDLKPDNVMAVTDSVVPGGKRVKVLDFGLAKVSKRTFDDALTTDHGALMGTLMYMAPEQCRSADKVDAKADVYSLGVMLFEFLSGQVPFSSTNSGEIIAMHLRDTPPSLQELMPALPTELCALVHSMLDKNPEARPTMSQVAVELLRLDLQATEPAVPKPVPEKSLLQSPIFWMALSSFLVLVLTWLGLTVTWLRHR